MARKSYDEAKALSVPKIILIIFLDVVSIAFSFFAALWFRFDCKYSAIPADYLRSYLTLILFWSAICVIVFAFCSLYNSIWRFVSTDEIFRIIAAYAVLAVVGLVFVFVCRLSMPRSFYVIGYIFSMISTVVIRFAYRLIRSIHVQLLHAGKERSKTNVMIVGAGEAGRSLVTEFNNSAFLRDNIVCAIDDNPIKKGKRLCGVPIVGNRTCIPEAVKKYNVSKIIYAIPSGSAQVRKEILDICATTNCQVQTVPVLYQL
ncbi:MAG: polysaccharide biosynthesis protein, partial [Clostridia bacterium]|nr:polysaccharide biosynthesis protein [Clostridia bacterium]